MGYKKLTIFVKNTSTSDNYEKISDDTKEVVIIHSVTVKQLTRWESYGNNGDAIEEAIESIGFTMNLRDFSLQDVQVRFISGVEKVKVKIEAGDVPGKKNIDDKYLLMIFFSKKN